MAKIFTGVYRLKFKGTDKSYIGQAVNINRRLTAHLYRLNKGLASTKLQKAFQEYGVPELEILCECGVYELDTAEAEAIQIFDSINNGFNTILAKDGEGRGYSEVSGEQANNAKYFNSQYEKILDLLILEDYSHREIAEITETSLSVVRSISNLMNHKWLKELHPEKYAKLEQLAGTYSHTTNNTAQKRGIVYPKLIAPDGSLHEVTHLREFARQHNMHSSNLEALLHGRLKSLFNWRVEGTDLPKYPLLLSPEGVIVKVPYGKAAEFAKINNMSSSNLSQLLNRKKKAYKGWTLVPETNDE